MARVYNQNVSGRVKITPGTELWPVSFSKTPTNRGSIFPKTFIVFMAHACFLDVSQYFPCGRHCSSINLSLRCKKSFLYTAENPSMRVVAKILRTRESEHSSNFCEQFEQRPNFASTFKLKGPFDALQLYSKYVPLKYKPTNTN